MNSNESIRVVIRKPYHPLLKKLAQQMNLDDYGEVINFLLLEFQRNGYNFQTEQPTDSKLQQQDEKDLARNLAAMF
ncbi:hypothetical protein COO91_01134 [Nostoc flagelliforme CCNUN1]|uniref:Uncharacterized protein n=1 Tax=Nostoc flagelliforme CCNUN1 TaxID=2038116 RepID=A0A2K8SIK8_9NOSO|nr:hypothetical protein [Nostoc flagelliforme]AUB35258.1 hypothetical protein COO91_01134 [Nostoc flagelliforme CCNUN1]